MTGPGAAFPRRIERRWRVAAVVGACAVLVAAVFVAYAEAPLAAPATLAHDPVPAEHIRWRLPGGCGIGPATLNALLPDATTKTAGEKGSCEWTSVDATGAEAHLDVDVAAYHAGADGGSSVAAAIEDFTEVPRTGLTARPVTGLGDEALVAGGTRNSAVTSELIERGAFRTGNVTVTAEYSTYAQPGEGRPKSMARLQAGVLRALTDTARALGAPAAPKVAAREPRPAPVRTPGPVCDLVSSGLRDRLVPKRDDDFSDVRPITRDPISPLTHLDAVRTRGCDLTTADRDLNVAITTSTAPTAVRDIGDEYLRRHLDARADQPVSRTDEKYFHAVSGLGDQAFAAYVAEYSTFADAQDTAVVVARSGPALITVTYGPRTSEETPPGEPPTRQDAVNGAYAVATVAVDAVRQG